MSEDEVPVLPPEEGEESVEEAPVEEEKSPAERTIRCRVCGKEVVFKHYMRHMKEEHPEAYEEWRRKMSESRKEAWARAKAEKEAEEEKFKEEEMPPEQLVSLYGREGLDKLKKGLLEKSLRAAPNVKRSQVEWVLYRWDTYSRCREDPQELFRVLHEEAGINERIANAIVQSVFSLESQYAHILARRGEPVYIRGPRYEERVPEYIYERPGIQQPPRFEYPQRPQLPGPPAVTEYYTPPYARERPWYQHSPWYQPQPTEYQRPGEVLTKDDVRKMLEEFYEKTIKEKEDKEEKEKLWKTLEGLKDFVEETRHEFEKRLLEIQSKKAEEGEPPEVRELKARLERYEEEIKKLEKTLEEREKKALESRIRSLESELRAARQEIASLASRPSEGYSQDTYRLLADTLHVVAQRRPLQDLGRILFPEKYYPQTQPAPSSRLPPEVEEELEKYGLIER